MIFKNLIDFIREVIKKVLMPDDLVSDFKRNYSKYSKGYKYY